MVTLPVFEALTISHYGLYPGNGSDGVLEIDLNNGLTMIAGVNGLGKTTMINMMLRVLTGDSDLSRAGALAKMKSSAPPKPRKLEDEQVAFFAQRVADEAVDATAKLVVSFGNQTLEIQRSLSNLALIELTLDGESIELPGQAQQRQSLFQDCLCDLFNLSSFVDVLIVLHNVVFFTDTKAGALWDRNSQRQILRALFLDKELASSLAQAEKALQSADSKFRNRRTPFNDISQKLSELEKKQNMDPGLKTELAATVEAIEGAQRKIARLEKQLQRDRERFVRADADLERARLLEEEKSGLVEDQKFKTLQAMFPDMHAAARLHLARILSDEGCLVCGAEAAAKRSELESLLVEGVCPACDSPPEDQDHPVELADARPTLMAKAVKEMSQARDELRVKMSSAKQLRCKFEATFDSLEEQREQLREFQDSQELLRLRMPSDSKEIKHLRELQKVNQSLLDEAHAELSRCLNLCKRKALSFRKSVLENEQKLSRHFARHIKNLLEERAKLTIIEAKAKLALDASITNPEVSIFAPAMKSAGRSGYSVRRNPSDVSESQRELMDLAFRLAIIDFVGAKSGATLIMETPESSLDGVAMWRVGRTLHSFSESKKNKLVVTSNLSNSGMIAALFGGPTKSKREIARRYSRVVNLLELAAPNASVDRDKSLYLDLLEECLTGQHNENAAWRQAEL